MSPAASEDIAIRRKKLRFRCWHRGTKELDLMLGPFADAHIDELPESQLDDLEALLNEIDLSVFEWITGKTAPPKSFQTELMARLQQFDFSMSPD